MKDSWREQMDLDNLHHQSDTVTSKDTCLDVLKVMVFAGDFPSSYESHTWKKKMRQERALYKGIEATILKPRILRRFGNYVSSWAQNFQLSKVLLTQVKGNFPAQRKAALQGSGKKVRRLLVHQSAPGKQHVNESSEHESGTYGLNFPRNTPGVQVEGVAGRRGENS